MQTPDIEALRPSAFSGRLFIHVGPHKTGTTTIQHFLSQHAPSLLGHGILYPETGRGKNAPAQHWALGEAVSTRDIARLNDFVAAIDRELAVASCDTMILSTEVLSRKNVTAAELAVLARAFPMAERIWIAVLRRQDELLPSLYSEQVKKGLIAFPQTYEEVAGPAFLDHVRRLETIAAASEADRIMVARFADIRHDVIGSFLRMIGISWLESPDDTEAKHRNQAMPGNALKALRYVNAFPAPLRRIIRPRLIDFSQRHSARIAGRTLGKAALDAVQKRYEPGNSALETMFFPDCERHLSHSPGSGREEESRLSPKLMNQIAPWHAGSTPAEQPPAGPDRG